MLFEENKFIKLSNLTHQLLKQCIENRDVKAEAESGSGGNG